jgi:hypothetical protein
MKLMGDSTMMHIRRGLGVAAATTTLIGLLLPAQGASATVPAGCAGSDNTTTKTTSLTADCVLTGTWVVDDGWTIDGNGFTISAAGVSGPMITNGPGTGSTPTTMTVGHATIDATGAGKGILFDGARGRVNGVTINGGQYGVEIDNTVGASFVATDPTDQVRVQSRSVISGYQDAAVHVTGGMRFTVIGSRIGKPATGSGQADGVFVEGLAHGAITENRIKLSGAEPASRPDTFRAGVRISRTLRVEVKRNVFTGADADFGVSVDNPGGLPPKTTAAVDCNLFRRSNPSGSDPFGVAVGQWSTGRNTNVVLTNATFEGKWKHDTGVVGATSVTAGATNVHDGHCPPDAPGHLRANGGNHKIKVTWRGADAPPYAPLTEYKVKAKAKGHHAITKKVGPKATSAVLKGLKNNRSYVVTVTAKSNGGKASATARARTGR